MNKYGITALIAALAVFLLSFSAGGRALAKEKKEAPKPACTIQEALKWAHGQKGKYIDMDGAYGAQCVDLIYAYYERLGVGRRGGNGADYQYDEKLPKGWERLYAEDGAVPMPGDVVVWAGGAYGISSSCGHVGIIRSVSKKGNFRVFEQNYGADRSVTVNPHKAGEFTCLLRPNWSLADAVSQALAQYGLSLD